MTVGNIIVRSRSFASLPFELLMLADPGEANIASYPTDAMGLVAELNGQVRGVGVLAFRSDEEIELLNIAVDCTVQKCGIGSRLLTTAIEMAGSCGAQRLTLGTGTFGYQLKFYQRHGFRVVEVERDYFLTHYAEPLWEDGIRHRDRLWLALEIAAGAE